jgi:hypothetical protein
MDSHVTSLLQAAAFWERLGYIASAVVVFGILLESFELLQHLRKRKLDGKTLEILGVLILILGLLGEVVSQVQSNNRTGTNERRPLVTP